MQSIYILTIFLISFVYPLSGLSPIFVKPKFVIANNDFNRSIANQPISFSQSLMAGAVSRSIAQTLIHPLNTLKTLLQIQPMNKININPNRLLRGAGMVYYH